MWQFARAVEGMGAACRALDIPITGGNVSLYNETDGRGDPADAGARRGRAARGRRRGSCGGHSGAAGDVVVLLGRQPRGARWLRVPAGHARADARRAAGARSRARRRRCSACSSRASSAGLIASAHDCAEGGLAVTLAECCFDSGLGVEVSAVREAVGASSGVGFGDVATLFGESASRVVVSRGRGAPAGAAGARRAARRARGGDRARRRRSRPDRAWPAVRVVDEPRERARAASGRRRSRAASSDAERLR